MIKPTPRDQLYQEWIEPIVEKEWQYIIDILWEDKAAIIEHSNRESPFSLWNIEVECLQAEILSKHPGVTYIRMPRMSGEKPSVTVGLPWVLIEFVNRLMDGEDPSTDK